MLLSTSTDAPNLARNMLIADGEWREAALSFDRAFYLFDAATLEGARLAWKLLAGRDGVERRYWAQDERGQVGREGLSLAAGGAARLGAAANPQPIQLAGDRTAMAATRTFSIIKPDATRRNLTGAVTKMLEDAGLRVVASKRIHMTRDQAEGFYGVHASVRSSTTSARS